MVMTNRISTGSTFPEKINIDFLAMAVLVFGIVVINGFTIKNSEIYEYA
jgi:hypothetical protein